YGLRNRGASPAIHNGLLYLVSDKSFFIINGRDGRIVVRKDLPYSVDVTSTPLLSSEMIVFGTAQHGLVALDAQTLEERWQSPVGDALVFTSPYTRSYSATIETSPVLSGDVIYVGASDGCLYGIDLKNGKTVWKHKMGAPIFSSVAISGNTLIASDFGGNIYSFCSK
ncbi:MAG: PQQ-like beta-propeller repeat protein, partial [Paramuribaculum sp.]|nr:PQQ-like beta-propeller repeat protein [Paramuribaculum sp.]